MKVALIAACGKNRVIGIENRLPWSLPDDLRRFRTLTSGHGVIMGRKTFESIGKPLPGRLNIVITRQADWSFPGVVSCGSLERALEIAWGRRSEGSHLEDDFWVFVIGGAEIYRLALPRANRLYLTQVEESFEGDAYFPEYSEKEFIKVADEFHPIDERHGSAFRFLTLDRKNENP